MPDALIVSDDGRQESTVLREMVRKGIVKMVQYKGVRIYGRPYLTPMAIRKAYLKQKNFKKV